MGCGIGKRNSFQIFIVVGFNFRKNFKINCFNFGRHTCAQQHKIINVAQIITVRNDKFTTMNGWKHERVLGERTEPLTRSAATCLECFNATLLVLFRDTKNTRNLSRKKNITHVLQTFFSYFIKEFNFTPKWDGYGDMMVTLKFFFLAFFCLFLPLPVTWKVLVSFF